FHSLAPSTSALGDGLIPPETHPADAWPVSREIALLAGEHFFGDGKDAARTQCWHAFRARLALMRRVRGGDLGLFVRAVMVNIIERHRRDAAIGGRLKQEAAHDLRHSEQGRERYPYRTFRHVLARQPFGV